MSKQIFTIEDIYKLRFLEFQKMLPSKTHKVPFLKYIFYKYLSLRLYNYYEKINLDINKIKRILVFRYDAIGDYFVTTPVLRWLKENIPNVSIDIVTSARNDSIISQDIFINKTFIVDEKSNYSKISRSSIKKMRKNKYDLVLSLVVNRTTRAAELATLVAPKAYKIAIGNREIYKKIFNLLVHRQYWISHVALQFYETLIKSFPEKCDISSISPYIPTGEKYFHEAIKFAQDNNLEFNPKLDSFQQKYEFTKLSGQKYIIINITSSTALININSSIELINILRKKYSNYVFFITGDPKKINIINQIVEAVNSENCRILSLSFNVFAVILAGSSLLISPDTATIHAAAFAGVPIVALYFVYYSIFEWYPLSMSKKFTIFHADASGYPSAELIARESYKYLDEQNL